MSVSVREALLRTPMFWNRVSITDNDSDCWNWTGYVGAQGYGRLRFQSVYWNAHRLAYTLIVGPIPQGANRADFVIMHSCDNRICCNPSHLSLGTGYENAMDCKAKGRQRRKPNDPRISKGSANGFSKLTETSVAEIKSLYLCGASPRLLADRYAVSIQTIYAITAGRNWGYIPALLPSGSEIAREIMAKPYQEHEHA